MNGPARQGTGPSRETLFITRSRWDGRPVRHQAGRFLFFLFFIFSPLSPFSSFSFIFVRKRPPPWSRFRTISARNEPATRVASPTVFTEICGASTRSDDGKRLMLPPPFLDGQTRPSHPGRTKGHFAGDSPRAKGLIIYR